MRIKTRLVLLVAAACLWPVSCSKADLTGRINDIINRPSERKVRFSIKIVKADSRRVVYSHNAGSAMVPASNMKLIVTAAALRYLGPDYEYKTRVGLCGEALVVIGSGDPLLGDKQTNRKYGRKDGWIFDRTAAALKDRHVTSIRDIIVDSSIFDDQRFHPGWPVGQRNREYACEVSGMNFNGNCVEITARNTSGKVQVIVEPRTNYVEIINKVVSIEKGKGAVGAYRTKEPNKLVVKGRCRKQQGPFAVAIERPAAFFGFVLAEKLAEAGINAQGQLIERPVDKDCVFRELFECSTAISDCLARCNKDSFGLAAEALLKTIAASNNPTGTDGSWAGGRKLIGEYLLALGIDQSEFYIDDGSGLSEENRLSANAVTKVLLDVYASENRRLYLDSLAVGGTDGTVAGYFREKKYKGRILGKTGYIKGVKSLSGICRTAGGDYVFSILANNATGKTRKAINDIVKAIVDIESFQGQPGSKTEQIAG